MTAGPGIRTRLLLPRGSAIALLLALAMAACTTTTRAPPPLDASTPADQEVQVTLRDGFTITASPASVPAGRVKFTITNEGSLSHGFSIEGQGLEQNIGSGTLLTRETRMTSGAWILYCPVADHRARGMQTQIIVG